MALTFLKTTSAKLPKSPAAFLTESIQRIYSDSVDPPEYLFHYTNIAGLIGIVNSQELWASNVIFLNDEMELQHGLGVASKTISRMLKDRKDEQTTTLLKSIVRDLGNKELPSTYATFSARHTIY